MKEWLSDQPGGSRPSLLTPPPEVPYSAGTGASSRQEQEETEFMETLRTGKCHSCDVTSKAPGRAVEVAAALTLQIGILSWGLA